MPSEAKVRYYQVETHTDIVFVHASRLDVTHGVLTLLEYQQEDGYALPQLTTTAVWPAGQWLSVQEISQETYEGLSA